MVLLSSNSTERLCHAAGALFYSAEPDSLVSLRFFFLLKPRRRVPHFIDNPSKMR